MSQVPTRKYHVKLVTNNWADGVLDATTTPPTYTLDSGGGAIPVSHWHPSTDKVGWTVTLPASGSGGSLSITFFGGHFKGNQTPVIQRGKAKGFPPRPDDDPEDTWSATDRGVGAEAKEPAGV